MAIDRAQLNKIYNALKELVSSQGAFVLFCVRPDELGAGENTQIRAYGPISRQIGLLQMGGALQEGHINEVIQKTITKLPAEPD